MTKSKSKGAAVSRAPPPSVASSSIVISRKLQNISLNKGTRRWQAWMNCMASKENTRGPYVGQHSTQILAARAQDRSLLKYRAHATKRPIWLTFPESDYASDEKLRNTLKNDEFIDLLKEEARACNTKVERTRYMQMYLEEEQARGNLPVQSEEEAEATSDKLTPLRGFLTQTFLKRAAKVSKLGRKHEAEADITKKVDDVLRDDNDMTDEVQDHQPRRHEEDLNLWMLATVALTHSAGLKPYAD